MSARATADQWRVPIDTHRAGHAYEEQNQIQRHGQQRNVSVGDRTLDQCIPWNAHVRIRFGGIRPGVIRVIEVMNAAVGEMQTDGGLAAVKAKMDMCGTDAHHEDGDADQPDQDVPVFSRQGHCV